MGTNVTDSSAAALPDSRPLVVVVMGVAGCGKTTVGARLATALGADFLDAQTLHTPSNRRRLSQGLALTDDDREPWIRLVGDQISASIRAERALIVACSALKRRYRDRLRTSGAGTFVHLVGERWQIVDRLGPLTQQRLLAPLIESQFAALEPLADDEPGFTARVTAPVSDVVAEVLRRLAESSPTEKTKRTTA